jgi:hypothetical protein
MRKFIPSPDASTPCIATMAQIWAEIEADAPAPHGA